MSTSPKPIKHIHQYVRKGNRAAFTKSGDIMYMCSAQHCYHALGRSRLLGKESICNDCHMPFILTRDDLQKAKPRCMNCKNTKEARKHKFMVELSNRILKEAETVEDVKRINADSKTYYEADDSPFPSSD